MNNTQFRRLVLDTPTVANRDNLAKDSATSAMDGAITSALGSRIRSNIPMTP